MAAVLLSSPVFRDFFARGAGPERARRELAPEIVVWVGEVAPGVKGVLAPVWGEPGPDAAHDRTLNAELGVPEDRPLGFYRLTVFNTSPETRTVPLADGAVSIQAGEDGPIIALRSLAARVRRGTVHLSPALEGVLRGQGTLEEAVTVPSGMMTDLLVAFEAHVGLEDAAGVRGTDGSTFVRRRIPRRELESLLQSPDLETIRDL